jgi:hypothetical protein
VFATRRSATQFDPLDLRANPGRGIDAVGASMHSFSDVSYNINSIRDSRVSLTKPRFNLQSGEKPQDSNPAPLQIIADDKILGCFIADAERL